MMLINSIVEGKDGRRAVEKLDIQASKLCDRVGGLKRIKKKAYFCYFSSERGYAEKLPRGRHRVRSYLFRTHQARRASRTRFMVSLLGISSLRWAGYLI